MYRKISIILIILSLFQIDSYAQESFVITGGDFYGNSGSVSFSIGQVGYTTRTGATGSVAQGVQQPYEISVISGIDDATTSLTFSVFPNPTVDKLTLRVESVDTRNLKYYLFDIGGKLVEFKLVEDVETTISMGSLMPSIYFLRITDGFKEIKTFKIIKN